MDYGGEFKQHVLLHRIHGGPVLDIGAVAQVEAQVGLAETVIDTALVDTVVEFVRLVSVCVVDIGGRCNDSAVGCGCRYRTCIHKGDE